MLKKYLPPLGFILLCQLAGIIGSAFTFDAIPTWYTTLTKPSFSPPNWIFGPVWTTLYTLMGISLYLVWKKGLKIKNIKFAFWFFVVHLAVNSTWSIIFFGFKDIKTALLTIIILWIMIAYSIKLFYKINKTAAYLLLPYFAWVSFAATLNYSLMVMNR